MPALFHVTFATVTPESAESGEAACHGWSAPNGSNDIDEVVSTADIIAGVYSWTLAAIVRRFGTGCCDEGDWFSGIGRDEDYRTGAETTYDVHPPEGVTAASYARIARVLSARR